MRDTAEHPLIQSQIYQWHLTEQAGTARAELALGNPLRKAGIVFAQAYKVDKDLFTTSAKEHRLFDDPHLEGIAMSREVVDAWYTASRPGCPPPRDPLRQIMAGFQAMKARVYHTLVGAVRSGRSCRVREEYRVTWDLMQALDPPPATLKLAPGEHSPFWRLPTRLVNRFVYADVTRWVLPIEYLRSRMHDQPGQRADPLSRQVESSAVVNALLRCLRAACVRGFLCESRALYRRDYHIRRGQSEFPRRGLDFQGSLERLGVVWLPADLFDWDMLSFRPEIVPLVEFDDSRLRRVFVDFQSQQRLDRSLEVDAQLVSSLKEGMQLRRRNGQACPAAQRIILDVLSTMHQIVFQMYIHLILTQLHTTVGLALPPASHLTKDFYQGYRGLCFDQCRLLLDCPPLLSQPRNTGHAQRLSAFPADWVTRLQLLFDWGDGFVRSWDEQPFRRRARRFYQLLADNCNREDAELFKRSLGSAATEFL